MAIVAGHVWRGLESASLIDASSTLFENVDRSLYMFHLSVFAFTAGLFVQQGMNRVGTWRYVRERDLDFLWLYVIWSTIQVSVKLVMGGSVNKPVSPLDLFTLWIPKEQFWFFPWIALMMIIAALGRPWRSKKSSIFGTIAVLGLSIVMWGIGGDYVGTQGLGLTAFFWVGLLFGGATVVRFLDGLSVKMQILVSVAAGAAMVLLVLMTDAAPPTEGGNRTLSSVALGIFASIAGVVAVLMLSALISRLTAVVRPIAYVGRLSLSIFVAHIFFTAVTRIVLLKFGIDSLFPQLLMGIISGVVGPLLLQAVCARMKLGWLFSMPKTILNVAVRQKSDVS